MSDMPDELVAHDTACHVVIQDERGWHCRTCFDLHDAIRTAHEAAQCGDYYCGCWDADIRGKWPSTTHTEAFLSALASAGYEIRRVTS